MQATYKHGKYDELSLARRLTLPKYLFREARLALSHHGPFSGGMATSLLQDSVESFLRILSEHGRVEVNDRALFHDLLGKVSKEYNDIVEHKASISRLNRARVGFKHHGLAVSKEDAYAFVSAVEDFLVDVSKKALHIDFRLVSLISQIGHRRTENWLHKAEELANRNDYEGSVICASRAMAIFGSYSSMWVEPWKHSGVGTWPGFSDDLHSSLSMDLYTLTEQIESIQVYLDLIMQGVDIVSYRRFRELTPITYITLANTIVPTDGWPPCQAPKPSKEDSHFCIEFVVESTLKILSNRPQGWSCGYFKERIRCAVAKHECEMIVHPSEDPPEVIRVVSVGERLSVIRVSSESYPDYAEVVQDDDVSYVHSNCICVSSPEISVE